MHTQKKTTFDFTVYVQLSEWDNLIVYLLQCDQIGLLLKSLGEKLSYTRGPNIGQLFGLFGKMALFKENLLLLGKILAKLTHFLFQHLVTLIFSYQSARELSPRG